MDAWWLVLGVVALVLLAQRADQRRRVALLGRHLGRYRIEQRMEELVDGYLRALEERDPARAAPVWDALRATEAALLEELVGLTRDLEQVWGEQLRMSRWPIDVPHATRFFPTVGFDFRALLRVHVKGLTAAFAVADGRSPRDRAWCATAELLLLQHSCHWYCRSRQLASARLLARHQTRYQQVLEAVAPDTRTAYEAVLRG